MPIEISIFICYTLLTTKNHYFPCDRSIKSGNFVLGNDVYFVWDYGNEKGGIENG